MGRLELGCRERPAAYLCAWRECRLPRVEVNRPEQHAVPTRHGNIARYGHRTRLSRRCHGEQKLTLPSASAAVAGLAAYLLSLGDLPPFEGLTDVGTPQRLKDYMLQLSYPRGPNADVNVFFNGISRLDLGGLNADGPVSNQQETEISSSMEALS